MRKLHFRDSNTIQNSQLMVYSDQDCNKEMIRDEQLTNEEKELFISIDN